MKRLVTLTLLGVCLIVVLIGLIAAFLYKNYDKNLAKLVKENVVNKNNQFTTKPEEFNFTGFESSIVPQLQSQNIVLYTNLPSCSGITIAKSPDTQNLQNESLTDQYFYNAKCDVSEKLEIDNNARISKPKELKNSQAETYFNSIKSFNDRI